MEAILLDADSIVDKAIMRLYADAPGRILPGPVDKRGHAVFDVNFPDKGIFGKGPRYERPARPGLAPWPGRVGSNKCRAPMPGEELHRCSCEYS